MKQVLVLLLLSGAAFAGTECFPNVGGNPGSVNNLPTSVCIKTYPDNGSDFNHTLYTWSTAIAGDSKVWLAHDADLTEASVSRQVYSSSSVTSHSVLVGGMLPNKLYGFYVETCTDGPNCSREDTHNSSAPFGCSGCVGPLYTFTTPDSNSSDSFDWFAYMSGAQYGLFQGHTFHLGINGMKIDGPSSGTNAPAQAVVTALSVGGQNCLPLLKGGATCDTHFTVQLLCSYEEIVNAPTNNYQSYNESGGPYSGLAFCYNTAIDTQHQTNSVSISIAADSSAPAGALAIQATIIHLNGSGVQVGSAQTVNYTVNVEAAPSFTYHAPTSFPGITNLNAWTANIVGSNPGSYDAPVGVMQNYVGLKTGNLTPPGSYNNDNASSTEYTINPLGVLTYRGGDQVPLGIMDYLNSLNVTAAFQANHSYNYGNVICTNGAGGCTSGTNYLLVVLDSANCVSGLSLGTVPAPGGNVVSGSCHFGNAGNTPFWLEMTERAATQHTTFLLNFGQYTGWQEWAGFAPIEWCLRHNVTCPGSKDAIAIGYMMYPFITGNGAATTQNSIGTTSSEPTDTLRSLPYDTENFTDEWLITGVKPVDGGVDELKLREDMLIQTLHDVIHYSTVDGVNSTYACCISMPSFDVGLGLEALIQLYDAQKAETGAGDAAIAVTVGRTLDWMWSNQFNLLGNNYSQPYKLWTSPFNSYGYNYWQPSLNNLIAPAFVWWWAMNGDTCTLPTSGVSCLTAAQTYLGHTFDNPVGGEISGKEGGEWYKWFPDAENWLSGNWTAYQDSVLPANNSYTSAWPQKMEPFPQGEWPSKPQATSVGSTTATIKMYNYGAATSTYVKYDLASRCTPSADGTTFTGGANSISNSTTGQYLSTISVTGLAANTAYCFGVGLTDSNGNASYTEQDITLNTPAPYQFQTMGSSISISGSLPNGIVGTAYGPYTLSASGGIGPYSWSVIFGALPAGVTLNSSTGVVSGTPIAPARFSPSIRATDSTLAYGTRPFSFVINPATGGQGSNSIVGGTILGVTVP